MTTGFDYFRILVDGAQQAQFSGTVAWAQWSMSLGAGSHTLELRYVKDGSVNSGDDTVSIYAVDAAGAAITRRTRCER